MLIIATTIWFLFLGIWTLFLYQQPDHNNLLHFLYNLGYAAFMLPAICVQVYKFLQDSKNKYIYIFFILSAISFFLANITWLYFNLFLETAVPYPSIADFLWLAFCVFSLIASILIFVSQSPKIANLFEIIFTTIILFLLLHSFMTQNVSVTSSVIITTLNFLYPLLDSFLVAIFLSILRKNPKSQNTSLPFLFSFLLLTLADALFAYQTNADKYWNGNITDLFFALSAYLFCLGCIRLSQSETLVSSPSSTQAKP